MMKRLSVSALIFAVGVGTAGLVQAQSTAQEAKDKTSAAAHKTGTMTSDAEISSAVKTKLLADRKVSGLKIDVDTDNHVVTLTGPVQSAAQKAEAVRVARRTHGVKRVVSRLTIEPRTARNHSPSLVDRTEHGAKKTGEGVKGTSGRIADDTKSAGKKTGRVLSDAEITTAVKTKMIADSRVHAMDINVDTDNGVVTLNGSVRSAAEKAEAMKIARHTHGVKRVVDKLAVK